jgi:hypothetical protein
MKNDIGAGGCWAAGVCAGAGFCACATPDAMHITTTTLATHETRKLQAANAALDEATQGLAAAIVEKAMRSVS